MLLSRLLVRRQLWRSACHAAVIAAVLLSVAGCRNFETHEPTFRDNEMAETVRKARPAKKEKEIDYLSFDERGRQIERNLAGQN